MNLPTSAHWALSLTGPGFAVGLADLYQCVLIILTTPVGSDPLRPDFGSRVHDYLDWPLDRARPHVVRETVDAVRRWEPRLAVSHVQVYELQTVNPGLKIRPYFKLADGTQQYFDVEVLRT